MFSTVFFDLDDTLFDHLGTARAALAATCADYPVLHHADQAALSVRYGELLEELHAQLLAGRYTVAEARRLRFERLLAPYGVAAAEAESIATSHYAHYQRLRQPLAGAAALLRALQPTCRIGIITNNRQAEQQDKLRALGLAGYVDALVTSEAVGVPKPDPRIFTVALQRLDAAPAEAVMVGDNWTADVLGALAVGIRPVWLNRTGRPAAAGAVAQLEALGPVPLVVALLRRVVQEPVPTAVPRSPFL